MILKKYTDFCSVLDDSYNVIADIKRTFGGMWKCEYNGYAFIHHTPELVFKQLKEFRLLTDKG